MTNPQNFMITKKKETTEKTKMKKKSGKKTIQNNVYIIKIV